MSFLLDTNILSSHFRRPSGLAHRFFQHSGRLYTASVALAELFVWAHNRPDPIVATLSLQLSGIRVAAYMTELPPRKVLREKLHAAIRAAQSRLDNRPHLDDKKR